MTTVDGRVALVTGANRGIGLAVAQGLRQMGATVVLAGRDFDAAAAAAAQVGATPLRLDVTDVASIAAAKAAVDAAHGGVDILINNAGIAGDQWVSGLDLDLDVMRQTLETNLIGALACTQVFVPDMRARGWGRVVMVSSELASLTPPSQFGKTLAYRSSKAALNAVTRFLAVEMADVPALKINAACPGWVKTDLGGPDAIRTVEEGADTIVWLAGLPDDGPTGGLFRDRAPYPW